MNNIAELIKNSNSNTSSPFTSNVKALFPVPVGIYHINNFKNTYFEIDVVDTAIFTENKTQAGIYNTKSNQVLNDPKLKDLKETIDSMVHHFLFNTLYFPKSVKPELVCSWAAIGLGGSRVERHMHTNSVYSGVCYLKSEGNAGRLTFHSGDNANTFCSPTVKPIVDRPINLNSDTWTILPKTGDVFIFPSHLEHSVSENDSDENRGILAFNYFLKGTISEDPTVSLTL